MKRILAVLLLALGVSAMGTGVFIGGEVIPHTFGGNSVQGVPYIAFGGFYLTPLGETNTLRLNLTGSTNSPLTINAWYGASLSALIDVTPEILWLGGGVGVWGRFNNYSMVDGRWSFFLEGRAVVRNFLNAYGRLHLPATVNPGTTFLGLWGSVGVVLQL